MDEHIIAALEEGGIDRENRLSPARGKPSGHRGGVFLGKVVNILPIGAQVELKPGKKGLVHISRLANHRVEKVEDEVQIGDEILVRVIAIKPDGKIDLTRKELLPDAKK